MACEPEKRFESPSPTTKHRSNAKSGHSRSRSVLLPTVSNSIVIDGFVAREADVVGYQPIDPSQSSESVHLFN